MPPLLVKSGIHFGATASSKEEAVALCGQALVALGAATSEYAAAMWEREQIASSYLGNYVAMPHGTDESRKFVEFGQIGWVKAGKDAQTAPAISEVPSGNVTITGRVRLESSLPRGSFFALPQDRSSGLISQANAQSHLSTEKFYLDLISGDNPDLTPKVPAELPELSDGPHLAYALQWLFFAGLVVYGRFLIRRDVLAKKEL